MSWLPETRIGKISFWGSMGGLVMMYIPYWIAIGFDVSIPIPIGLASIVLQLLFGTLSLISILKHKDRAILLFMTSLFGLFALVMVIGELVFPH
ncbi:MAG: hypothetical protein ABIH41_06260 [Nanoarchaeota archaeon]